MKIPTFMYALQWTEKKQNTFLLLFLLFSPNTTLFALEHKDDFIAQIHEFERNMQKFQNNMMQVFEKNMHHTFDKFFADFDTRAAQLPQQNCPAPICNNTIQHNSTSYYQSSSSLSFVTNDKHIKITENKNDSTTLYSIEVVDQKADTKAGKKQNHHDPVTDLQELQGYMKTNIQSCKAQTILQECIHALTHEQKGKTVTAETTSSGPRTTYTIQLDTSQQKHKENTHDHHDAHEIEEEDEVKTRKKKKSNNFTPRPKDKENFKL